MVKGISKRVIVVRAPDPRFFDEAIFFLREDVLHQDGVTDEQVLSEARRVAAGYLRRVKAPSPRERIPSAVKWGGLGALSASLVWSIICFL